ncbi:cell division protein PerM [Micromonospora sp. CA-263727]|uniref:cell division protein PerM n=1 Tax=Micromonospora sp. CA-263727 TaxID=3239967 RepID=UPI003D8F2BE4
MSFVTPDQPRRATDARGAGARPPGRAGPPRRAPVPRAGTPNRSHPPLAVAALVAAGGAALTSWLPVAFVLWLFQLSEGAASLLGAVRAGAAGWLLGHGVPLATAAGPLGLAPLAVTALAIWRLTRAGVHASRAIGARGSRSPGRTLVAATAVGIVYALLGVLAALLVGAGGPGVSPVRAGLTLAVVGTLAAGVGAARTTGLGEVFTTQAPVPLREGVRAGVVAGLVLLGAGAAVAGLAVATGGGDAADLIGAYRTGVAGQAGITLVSLAYAPNATVWSTSYLLGPGFAVGTDTAVRTSEVSVGALPALPLFAGLPSGPIDGLGSAAVLAVPVLVGMAAGWLLARRLGGVAAAERTPLPWRQLLAPAVLAGPVAGLLLGVAAAASGGPLGAGRLAEVGPVGWQVALVATLVTSGGALLGAAATRWLTQLAG